VRNPIEIQDVEQLRQRVGIDDVELREQVRRLRVGDVVRLTFLAGPGKAETLAVRVTAIRRARLSGELVAGAKSPQLAGLSQGSPVTFTRAHVHSVQGPQAGMSCPRAPEAVTEPKAGPHGWPDPQST
jgi:hypothetical protein